MERKLLPFSEEDKEKFKDIVFAVEATHFEQLSLWVENELSKRIKSWEQIYIGYTIVIGYVDDMPVAVCLTYAKLNGHKVVFYEAVSQIVDHDMVRKWIDHHNPNSSNHSDAMNFGHCYRHIGVT